MNQNRDFPNPQTSRKERNRFINSPEPAEDFLLRNLNADAEII